MDLAKKYNKAIDKMYKHETIFKAVFIPKYRRFPKICKKLKLGKWI